MSRSHLGNTRTPRYRPIFSSARRDTGHSSGVYGARGPTPQSGKWAITLRAAIDFPPGRRQSSLKYTEYVGVALAPPDRKIIGSGSYGDY